MNVASLETPSATAATSAPPGATAGAPAAAPPNDDQASDANLATRAARGSSDAFTVLFNRYYAAIHAFAWHLTFCPAEAADIAQDTFIQAAISLPGYRHQASFKNWLHSIALNKTRDRRRQHARQARLSADIAVLADTENTATSSLADSDPSTRHHSAVRDALTALAPALREAVALVYFENMNHAEAARVLGCAESTVSWRIFCAKRKLKHALRHERL
ncbi:RNA polymerase sigma factor [Opitutaceae bacterium TAV4]|nr:RNA polymerase sigma factor [Opitutaceae bacterium TAV4]RRK00662.1 RNA polymerase sigma factor [Opitutaceae bacterium TAV3]